MGTKTSQVSFISSDISLDTPLSHLPLFCPCCGWAHMRDGLQLKPRQSRCFGQTIISEISSLKIPILKSIRWLSLILLLRNIFKFLRWTETSLLQELSATYSLIVGYLADKPHGVPCLHPTKHFSGLGVVGGIFQTHSKVPYFITLRMIKIPLVLKSIFTGC
jgi:hypothetical protein